MYKIYFLPIFIIALMLSGCMPAIFTGAVSSTMAVAGDRSVGTAIDDTKIAARIKADFVKNNFRELYTKISVSVLNARVLYTGTVDKEEDMLTAVQIAWNQKDVKEVVNELIVDKNSGHFDLVQYTRDSMITTQIKSKAFLKREIKFVNYTVITVNDIVYLFGSARSEEELEQMADIASKVHGVKKVISHVKIIEPSSNAPSVADRLSDDNT
ncbi:BON domain-containing protein [Candidatus Trichorickettsia mobilis]|uniref:BON domain-containing protein n=1 Tax=Candidatus Trichorickettsia mobilis TaxID=1346319 RepID=A0ABZ0USH7_9RICK|nr:BON domain-containing protein [Candidatus Trichorickettsia mobilis]WPY00979.1 BON domain-containing protein [Candidatus Trichorickettsia mobilis]